MPRPVEDDAALPSVEDGMMRLWGANVRLPWFGGRESGGVGDGGWLVEETSLAGEGCRWDCWLLEVETPRGRPRRKEPKIVVVRAGGPLASLINTGDVASIVVVVFVFVGLSRGYFSGIFGTRHQFTLTYSLVKTFHHCSR